METLCTFKDFKRTLEERKDIEDFRFYASMESYAQVLAHEWAETIIEE